MSRRNKDMSTIRHKATRRRVSGGIMALLLMLTTALSACGAAGTNSGSGSGNAPIRIGFSITETGANSAPALFDLQGYQLGAEAINSQGGLLGRQVQLDYYDDQGSTATAVQLYQKLITSDKVDLLVEPY